MGQKTSGMVRTTPTKGVSGSVAHCSLCQSCVPRLPQLGQHLDSAGVVEDLLFGSRGKYLTAQSGRTTRADPPEIRPHGVTFCGSVPLSFRQFEDLAQTVFWLADRDVAHILSAPWY